MLVLLLFNLGQDLVVGGWLVKVLAADLAYVIEFRIFRLVGSLQFSRVILDVIFSLLSLLLHFVASALEISLLSTHLHYFSWSTVVVLLQLLQLTTLFEQCLWRCATLLFQNLFSLKIGSFSTLHELVSVVLIAYFQMVQRVRKRLDLFFALSDLAVQLVTIARDFFFLLCGFDNVVGLRSLLTVAFSVSRLLVTGAKSFVLYSKVLDFLRAHLQFNCYFVSFFFSCFQFRYQDIFVNLNLFFAFLHRHFQLVLSVLKTVNSVSFCIDSVSQLLDLKFHDIVLNEGLLLLLSDFGQVDASHFVFQDQLLDSRFKTSSRVVKFLNHSFNYATFIL